MRYYSAILFLFCTITCFATGQDGELIIYNGDTLTMLCEPLEIYLQKNEPRKKLHPSLENGCSTALWRGYVGLWKIEDDRLLLLDVFVCGNKKTSIRDRIFKGQDSVIIADWFTGDLFVEKGRVIKYNHSGYDRIYEHEIVIGVTEGIVQNVKSYDNGVKPNDHGFSRDPDVIYSKIYKSIDWNNIPKLSRDYKLYVTFQIGENGKLINTKIDGDLDEVYKKEVTNALQSFPPVQVLFSRGQPALEGWTMKIEFSGQNKRKYAR